jgi:hypothetical protein
MLGLKTAARHFVADLGADPLTRLANQYGSDKGNLWHGRHRYAEIYHRLLAAKQLEPITLLEIGLLHPFDTTALPTRAPSLQMWRDYFPNARLVGFDINDFRRVAMKGCTIYRGDMGERSDLTAMANDVAGQFDIIIDDGSHASHHQQIALATLFPCLRSGGAYFIEDLNWVPSDLEKPDVPRTRKILQSCLNGEIYTPVMSPRERDYLRENIMSVEFFNSHDRLNNDRRDALAAIRKR